MNWFIDLICNPFFLTGLSSWAIAQVLKVIIYAIVNKKFDIFRLFGDGGMPSGHSATVTSLAVLTAITYGTGTFEFALSALLAIIVCHDAMGVRLETGKQAILINEIIKTFDILAKEELPEVKLKEFVGHTPMQVLMGILIGFANAFVMYNILY
ncbi:MAG: divergent PAP2 family protein [Clostridia bacterium]|nr:divergent PAP2 family protein [Clostridia bacterium]